MEPGTMVATLGRFCSDRAVMTDPYPPEYWQARADDALAVASHLEDPECRRVLLRIAEAYGHLARDTARRQSFTGLPATDQDPPATLAPS